MFCAKCGSELSEGARFCSACGAPANGAQATPGASGGWARASAAQPAGVDWVSRLQRPRTNRMVAGVCAGLAQHYGWDLTWVRVLTVLITVFSSGAGLVAYLVFWIVMPEQPWMLPQPVSAATTTGQPFPPAQP